jgi:hypothetical protein
MYSAPGFIRRLFTLLLTATFFVETTPDQLWHLFAQHEDTNHGKITETSIDLLHIHCDALLVFLHEFAFPEHPIIREPGESPLTAFDRYSPFVPVCFSFFQQGRAPPALAS